jgi:signal peptidase
VVGAVANLLLAAVTLACLAWLLPSVLGYERYVITGGSMSGTFEKGSLAFEQNVPTARLRVGDVITYQPPADSGTTDLVTHRIVRISQDERGRQVLRTKGDANAAVDPWTFRLTEPTQPVVQFTVPLAGHVFIALADRETRMLAVGVPAALVALVALGELLVALTRRGDDAAPAGPAAAPVPGQRRVEALVAVAD